MFGSVVLELFIGVAFLFLALSIVITAAQEMLTGLLGMRSANLVVALRNLLEDPDGSFVREVMEHPAMRHLYRGKPRSGVFGLMGNGPSYVPSSAFATALLDALRSKNGNGATLPVAVDELFGMAPEIVRDMPEGVLKRSLTLMIGQASDLDRPLQRRAEMAERRLAQWFDESMDRASGWYKRKSQFVSVLLSIGLVVAINANALTYMELLWKDSNLREGIVAAAEATAAEGQPLPDDTQARLDDLAILPLGWQGQSFSDAFCTAQESLKTLAGWAITVLAISLGAAFWFDVMKKALAIRASGPKPTNPAAG
ncbi:hypothetical protein J7399_18185 [Shimia sp. R9_1]|uniref:hypothetical protein n=1 Tax=Shimia sp. R9_1 TaxID=2821111 RepID=UPI001ADA6BF3|nr:hypothetical protein [Shimia sp. R9_1]MBO9409372.1 hypothetical protein [Shimia sp. R9_1]